MRIGLPSENSVFDNRTIEDVYAEIRNIYLQFPQPWVIGYSGGKDSTTVVQLVWDAIQSLPKEKRNKPVFVIASDTKVETPIIVNHITETIGLINSAAENQGLPFQAEIVTPTLHESFWVNLIGRGYPAPTIRFRWCTERMKINPANRFIEDKVTQFGEVILVLGVRSTESTTRMQLMNSYKIKNHVLRRHTSLPGAYVYAPIEDFSTDDVWSFLNQQPSTPWGGDNRKLQALYRNANAGECPLVIDNTTPSCGISRFGCWVCTVASSDVSVQAMIDNGEDWMQPLLEFRDELAETTDPARKREFRDIKGRDGRVILTKDGKLAARTYKLEVSKSFLYRLLIIQNQIRAEGPDPNITIISEDELHEIRRIWRTERLDWDDSVPKIAASADYVSIRWPMDDDGFFELDDKRLLGSICDEYDVPFELVAKLLQHERQTHGMARRSGIQKSIRSVLREEWRTEEEILKGGKSPILS